MGAPAVVAEGLRKRYGGAGGVLALDRVDLSVEQGTVLGVLGPNGAGKTTTVRILTTLVTPDSGRARVAGVDVVRHPDQVRSLIGLAGQYAAVDDNLTGRENLLLVAKLNHLRPRDRRHRAAELLEQFGLVEAGDRPARTYSGGMRRRLDLAAALVNRPPVLFLDEPTTGLDPRSRIDLWATIDQLVQDGTTLLLTTQYLEEADRLADRIAVIDHGRVIAWGTPGDLKARMGATVLDVGFDDENAAGYAATVLRGIRDGEYGSTQPIHDRGSSGLRIPVQSGAEVVVDVVRRLDAVGLPVRSLQLREPSLDDVFLRLTGRAASDGDGSGTTSGALRAARSHRAGRGGRRRVA